MYVRFRRIRISVCKEFIKKTSKTWTLVYGDLPDDLTMGTTEMKPDTAARGEVSSTGAIITKSKQGNNIYVFDLIHFLNVFVCTCIYIYIYIYMSMWRHGTTEQMLIKTTHTSCLFLAPVCY
jgi:hypothetical protein